MTKLTEWVTIKEASVITKLHPHSIRKYIKEGIFEINKPFIKQGSKIMVSKDSLIRKYSLPAYTRQIPTKSITKLKIKK